MPEAQKLYAKIQRLRKEDDAIDVTQDELGDKLREVRRGIERGDDAEIAAARKNVEAAGKAEREAYKGEALQGLREPRDNARRAYGDKVKELLAADAKLAELKTARDALRQRIREAEKKIRAAQGK